VKRLHSRKAVLWIAIAALLFVAGTYLAPVLEAPAVRAIYAPLCHQDPERSFEIMGVSQAICARCAGLYLGGVAGLFAAAWLFIGRGREPRPLWLACALAPTVIDALFGWLGLPALAELPRHIIAWPAGFFAGLFLAVGIADLELSLKTRHRPVEDFNG
jgi:uncharacterized membrane protein